MLRSFIKKYTKVYNSVQEYTNQRRVTEDMNYHEYDEIFNLRHSSYIIKYDSKSNGLYLMDNMGNVLGSHETEALIKGLQEFQRVVNDNSIRSANIENYKKTIIYKTLFNQIKNKKGTIFIYKETGTNHYRLGFSQDFDSRIKNIQSALPVDIIVVSKHEAEYGNLLKDFLALKFEKRHAYDNWYIFDEKDIEYFSKRMYQDEFARYVKEMIYRSEEIIYCSSCNKKVSSLEYRGYCYCILCRDKYCSEECAERHHHMDKHIQEAEL